MISISIFKTIRLIGINCLIFLLLLFLFNMICYSIVWWQTKQYAHRSRLDIPMSSQEKKTFQGIRDELLQLNYDYSPFEGWKYQPFKGQYVNIDKEGYRFTSNPNNLTSTTKRPYWFFGGSVMWGFGVEDKNTIPSVIAKDLDTLFIKNYAEQGYNSRQVLARLINLLNTNSNFPQLVITMDGVNDLGICLDFMDIHGHFKQNVFDKKGAFPSRQFANQAYRVFYQLFISNTSKIAQKIRHKLSSTTPYRYPSVCESDTNKAKKIARQIIENWKIMHNLVEKRGGKFIALLQPTIHNSQVKTNYVKAYMDVSLTNQYSYIYNLVNEIVVQENLEWVYDLSNTFDNYPNDYIYTDECHLTNRGNEIVANRIKTIITNEFK